MGVLKLSCIPDSLSAAPDLTAGQASYEAYVAHIYIYISIHINVSISCSVFFSN